LPFKFVGAVFNRIVNNMFVFILCVSDLIFYPYFCIDNLYYFFIFVE
jgi:hypothetical protein